LDLPFVGQIEFETAWQVADTELPVTPPFFLHSLLSVLRSLGESMIGVIA